MEFKILRTMEELEKLKPQWEQLQDSMKDSCFYDTYEYFYAWWSANQQVYELFLICIEEGKQLIGLAPLVIYEYRIKNLKKLSLRTCSFIDRGDFHNFLIMPQYKAYSIIKKLFEKIDEYSEQWERLWLVRINPMGALGNYILSNNQYNEFFKHKFVCPYIDITKAQKEEYFSIYPTRKRIKEYEKVLKKRTDYSLNIIKGGSQKVYKLISDIHIKEKEFLITEKGRKERKSHFELNDKEYLEKLYGSSKHIVTFFLVSKDGEVIAYNTCYEFHNVLNSWNLAYNPAYQKYSPSNVLYHEIIKYLFEEKKYEGYRFDFGSGNYPWKHQFTNKGVYNFSLDYLGEGCRHKRFWKYVFWGRDIARILKNHY